MPTNDTPGSPALGIIPEPVRVRHDEPALTGPAGGTRTAGDLGAERDARREAREARRGAPAARSGVTFRNRPKRLSLEAPLMRGVAMAGIVGIALAIAAIMGSHGAQGWLIGLGVSTVSLMSARLLWSSRRADRPVRYRLGCDRAPV
jgi:hypothetical protein